MQETDWFPLTHCPIRHGVYKTLHLDGNRKRHVGYSKWSHRGWGTTCETVAEAEQYRYPSTMQSKQWKGIIKEVAK